MRWSLLVLSAAWLVGCNSLSSGTGELPKQRSQSSALGERIASNEQAASRAGAQAPAEAPAGLARSQVPSPGSSQDGGAAPTELPKDALHRVALQPLGPALAQSDLAAIERALGVFYHVEVMVLPPQPLPQFAYYPPRQRYRAEKLLAHLQELMPEGADVIVGLTTLDISTTKGDYPDWGILGLATVGGEQCVISRFRAARGAQNEAHVQARLAKTVVHEVGHNFGLSHCPHHGCLMEDGKGTVLTSDHEYDLCDSCRAQLTPHARERRQEQIPWPNPWAAHEVEPAHFDGLAP